MEIYIICILSSSHHIIRDLKQRRRRRQQQRQKNDWVYEQNNCSARASRFLIHFFDVYCTTTTWKPPNATFCGGRGHTTTHFPFSIWTWIKPLRIQLHWRKVAYIWIIERFQIDVIKFERTQIHFFSDVFTAVVIVVAWSLMHCIRFWNLFKIWRVLEATYLKLHGKKKNGNKNLRTHLRTELGHCRIRHLHISHNTPCLPPKILYNLCFSFLLGITAVRKETDDNVYAQFWGGKLDAFWDEIRLFI